METKRFEFYWDDLTSDCQARLQEFLGGENGNYDVIPFAVLEIAVEPDKPTVEPAVDCFGHLVCKCGRFLKEQDQYCPECGAKLII